MPRDIDLQKRQAILNHLKKNDGAISYDDLVRIGVFQPGELAESGFSRWLQNLGGGPAHLHELLEEEYNLNNQDTSFANLDQEQRQRRSAEQTMLLAMIAAPAIDGMLNGPGGVAFGDNVYDNIERYGTQGNFKGSNFSWKPTEPGSLVESTGETVYSPINHGPLNIEDAKSINGATYTKKILTEDTTFYRVYGGKAEMAGRYMSRTPQYGGMQSQLDLALNPKWGNKATYVIKVTVPKGTVIYEGTAAPQAINGGAGILYGGGNQVFIPEVNPSWFGS